MALINDMSTIDKRRNSLRLLVEKDPINGQHWLDLYAYKLDKFSNLADLTDKDAAIHNLGLDDKFISKEVALHGREPGTIHHTMIRQTTDARFVSDNQVRHWNSKSSAATGIANFAGLGRETTITHNITDIYGNAVVPVFCTYMVQTNPNGTIGEVWMRWDATNIYVGNSGSYTGTFTWLAIY